MSALKATDFDEWWFYWSSDFSTERDKQVARHAWDAAERAAKIRRDANRKRIEARGEAGDATKM